MASIDIRPIPCGSHAVRLWESGSYGDRIDAVGVLTHESDAECEFAMAHGNLTRAMLRLIAKTAHGMGYQVLRFSRPKGALPLRFAERVGGDEHLEHYRVDLGVAVQG